MKVFVSYIRRYVLTPFEESYRTRMAKFSSPIFGDMFLLRYNAWLECSSSKRFRLLYSEICSYWAFYHNLIKIQSSVFVSYIRRYVLTFQNLIKVFAALWFSSPIFGDMFLLGILRKSNQV